MPLTTSRPASKNGPHFVNLNLHTIKRYTASLVWLLAGLLFLFPVSHHALPGIVLCIEKDGRIEIENGWTGDCATEGREAREVHREHRDYAALEDASLATDACGTSCIDMLLFASPADGQAASAKQSTPQMADHLLAAVTTPVAENDDAPQLFSFPSEPSAPPATLTALRTVVLLI
jgi:hypothetical protein